MAPPRKSKKVLQLNGTVRRNPGRYASRNDPAGPETLGELGAPPDHLDDDAKAAWNELAEIDAAGNRVLTRCDRIAVEMAAWAMSDFRKCPEAFTAARQTQLQRLLKSFGMVGHGSRQDLPPPEEEPKGSPLDEFLKDF